MPLWNSGKEKIRNLLKKKLILLFGNEKIKINCTDKIKRKLKNINMIKIEYVIIQKIKEKLPRIIQSIHDFSIIISPID